MAKRKAVPTPKLSATNWEAQSALETLKRARQIEQDPKLMRQVREQAKQDRNALTKVIGRGGSA